MDVEHILRERLRSPWNYGVTSDGRIFFINEETRTTTWLHPERNVPVQSGYITTTSLPRGWELDHTVDGIPYFIDHGNQKTSFQNPVTGEHSMLKANLNRAQEERKSMKRQKAVKPQKQQRTKTIKETPAPRRNFNAPVSLEGWLYRPDSGKKTNWKKRWAVISDFCIYFYKDREEREETGALSLPSYDISPVDRRDDVSKDHAFKACHQNMATQYFCAVNQKDMHAWVEAMQLAANVQSAPTVVNQRSEDDEQFGFSQSQGQSSPQRSPQGSMRRYDQRNQISPPHQQPYHDPYSQKRYPSDHIESQSNSGSYGSGRYPSRDPYAPNLAGSQQGSYRVNSSAPDGRMRSDPDRDSRLGSDSYRPDSTPRDRTDSYGRGTLPRENRLPRDSRNASPSGSTQISTLGPPSAGYNRGYPQTSQPGYRQTPQADHRPFHSGDPHQGLVDRTQFQSSQRSLSSDRYDSTLQRDSRSAGYSQPVIRPHEGERGVSDNQGTSDRNTSRYNQRPQSDPRDHRASQNTYQSDSRSPPNRQSPQRDYGQPFRTNETLQKSPLMREKRGASDPRNVQARYPSDTGADVSRDRFSERSVDVPRGLNERTRDDESVSDDGGFKGGRQGQRQWSSPHDRRSDPPQQYRDSFHSDRSRDQRGANEQSFRQSGNQWRTEDSLRRPAGGPQPSSADSMRRSTHGYPQSHAQPPSQAHHQRHSQPHGQSTHQQFQPYDRSRPQDAHNRLASHPPVNGTSPTSDLSSSQSSRSLQGQRYGPRSTEYPTRPPAEGQYWDSQNSQQRGPPYEPSSQRDLSGQERGVKDNRHEGQGQQRRYFEPLTIDTANLPGQNVSRVESHGTPLLQAETYHSQSPGRPPLPTELMPQYVQELAEASTPVTRNDMLTSMQTAIQRKEQPQQGYHDNRDNTSRQQSYREPSRQSDYQANQPNYQGNQPGYQRAQPVHQASQQQSYKDTSRQSSYRDSRQPGYQVHSRQASYTAEGRMPSYRTSQPGSAQPTPSMQRRTDQGPGDNQRSSRAGSTQPSPWMDRRNHQELERQTMGRSSQYSLKQPSPMPQKREQTTDSRHPSRQPDYGRDLSSANEASYQTLSTQEAMPYQPGPLAALLSNQRPPAPRVDPPKSATEQFRENRKSGDDYSRELEDKEMHRLRKHIDASYKRLSLGSELGRRFMEKEGEHDDIVHHPDAASFGGDASQKARRSLDWEMESSLFSHSVVNSSQAEKKFSTPLEQTYANESTRTYLTEQAPDLLRSRVPDGEPSPVQSVNRNLNNNGIPSPASGFSKFVSDTQTENNEVRRSYAEQPEGAFGDFSGQPEFSTDSLRQSYLENDDVAIVDVEERDMSPIAGVMEDIGMDVKHIKERINNLRNLMEAELAEAKGSPLPDNGAEPNESFERESAEGEQLRDASQRLFLDQREEARQNLRVSDMPQRHSYAGYQDTSNIDILPPRYSLAHYGDSRSSAHPAQRRDILQDELRYPHMRDSQHQMPPGGDTSRDYSESSQRYSFSRQESDRSMNASRQRNSYSKPDSNRHYGGTDQQYYQENQRDLPSKRSSYASQGAGRQMPVGGDRYGHVPTAVVDGSLRDGFASGREHLSHHTRQNAEPMDVGQGREQPQHSAYKFEGFDQDLPTISSESPFKHLQTGTRDDSALFDGPRSWHNQDSSFNQNRPKSYAGGLIGAPLTKLEKLEMENRISKSMGTLNIKDLEESAKILTGQADTNYDAEWSARERAQQGKEDPFREYDPYSRVEQAPPVPPKSPGVGRRPNVPVGQFEIGAIKEDPNMADSEVLDDKKLARLKQNLEQHRLRLSISANDLIGKSHEELVLLLIQLKRAQARLESDRDYYRSRLEEIRPTEKQYKLKRKNSVGRLEDALEQEHEEYVELRKQSEEIENQLEVHKPLVNLVDNLVTMGSLYGGDNLMLASQYKKHKLRPDQYIEPKEMIEFSRKHQEERLLKEQEEDLRKLTEEEIELEEKLQQLFELDKALQDKSIHVSNLQEDRELLDKAMQSLLQTIEWETDPREQRNLQLKKQSLEDELTMLRQRLAEASKDLEETTAENAKVENEVILLRKKVYGMNKSHSSPNLTTESMKNRIKMERELDKVQAIMQGLNQQGATLQQTINTLRRSQPDLTTSPKSPKYDRPPSSHTDSTYYETDIDSMTSRNIAVTSRRGNSFSAVNQSSLYSPPRSRDQTDSNQKLDLNQNTVYNQSDRWNSHTDFNQSNNNYSKDEMSGSAGQGQYRSDLDVSQSQGQDGIYTAKRIFVQSPAPSRKNIPVTEVHPQSRSDGTSSDLVTSSHMDISQADDNTKRFYGILPKEKAKSQTVRDLKKRESERKSRDVLRSDDGSESDVDARARSATSGGARLRSQSLPRRPPTGWGEEKRGNESPAATKKFSEVVRRPRKARDPERRKSAVERLFAGNSTQAPPTSTTATVVTKHTTVSLNDKDRLRRMSDIFTPRPFGASSSRPASATIRPVGNYSAPGLTSPPRDEAPREGEPHDIEDEQPAKPQVKFAAPGQRNSPITVATVRPVPNPTAGLSTSHHTWKPSPNTATVPPNNALNSSEAEKHRKIPKSALKQKRNEPRRQTISSSQPAWLEQSAPKGERLQSAAGDLISVKPNADFRSVIKSSSVTDMNYDDETIDKMVLFKPSKVEIPERYVPDSDEESVTEEERLAREEKSASLRKIVVAQSLQDWKEGEIGGHRGSVHTSLEAEQHRREHLLDIRQALAREVTQRSKQVAGLHRKTHSAVDANTFERSADFGIQNTRTFVPIERDPSPPPLPPRLSKGFYM